MDIYPAVPESMPELNAPNYRIVVADDHPLFREAIVAVVRRTFAESEILEATDLASLQALDLEDVDLLLLDLNMPGVHGLSGLVHVRAQAPAVAVIVVTAMDDAAVVQRAIGLGAAGFVPKSSNLSEISKALETVLAGGISLPERFTNFALAPTKLSETEISATRRIGTLTPQQFRIATLLAAGMLNKQIAWDLGIAEATVKVHMSTILRKLNVRNRTQVALLIQVLDFEGLTGADVKLADEVVRAL